MNRGFERKHNLFKVIHALQRQGAMTQAQLKEHCGLLASTLSYSVRDLRKFGFITDLGQAPGEGKAGKPGTVIGLNNQKTSFLGIYLEDNLLDIQVIGIDETILYQHQLTFDLFLAEEVLFTAIRDSLAQYPQIQGIGIAVKGIVSNDGTIHSLARQEKKGSEDFWNFRGFADKLKEAFPRQLFAIENDANCAAVEVHHGTDAENENLVVYLLNHRPFGLGCGILIKGSLYRGARGAAGEIFEKDSRLRDLRDSLKEEDSFVSRIIPAILPHILRTAWLLDPDAVVLAGSYIENLPEEEKEAALRMLKSAQFPSKLKINIESLSPARGAALLVAGDYINGFLEEVKKR